MNIHDPILQSGIPFYRYPGAWRLECYRESAARTATPPLAIFLSVEEGVGSGSDLVSEAHGGDPSAWWGCVASRVMDAQRGELNW